MKSCLSRMALKHLTWHHDYNTEHSILTPHVIPCLQPPQKIWTHNTEFVLKIVSDDDVFTSKLIRPE